MADVIKKEPYKAKRLLIGTEIAEDPNYVPKRAQKIESPCHEINSGATTSEYDLDSILAYTQTITEEEMASSTIVHNKSRLVGKRLQSKAHLIPDKKNKKVKKAKRITPKTKKPNIFTKIFNKIANNKIVKIISKIICFIAFLLSLFSFKSSSKLNVASKPVFPPLDYSSMELENIKSIIKGSNIAFQNRDSEVVFMELDASEKVDYLMEEYNLTLDELRYLLFALDSKLEVEHRKEVDNKYSNIRAPEVKYVSDDLVSYSGPVTDLLSKLNVSIEDYNNIIAPTLIKAGGNLNYKEAFALMTVALNRLISTEYPNNLLDVITAPGGFNSYESGEYASVNINDYPDALEAFTDCLWNFIQDQTIRLHDYTEIMPWEENREGYEYFFNILGNHYGGKLLETQIEYQDIEPFLTYG